MTKHKRIEQFLHSSVILASVLAAVSASAQTVCRERVLIPVSAHRVPGLNGSLWQTHLAITNHSARPMSVLGHGACQLNPCPAPADIQPESTIYPRVYTPFLEVDCSRASDVTFQLRVQDLSRQSETWGTTIPVVREADLFDGRIISITDIPNTAEFRSLLRVYGFEAGREGTVLVRAYAVDETIAEGGRGDAFLVQLQNMVSVDPLVPHSGPAYLQLPLWSIPELATARRVRIEVEGSAGLRLWAFVSATNNATHHVTVLLPR